MPQGVEQENVRTALTDRQREEVSDAARRCQVPAGLFRNLFPGLMSLGEPLRCPVCRAENTQGPSCRRCKADLSLLFALEEQRRQALGTARDAAARGAWRDFLAAAARADELRS